MPVQNLVLRHVGGVAFEVLGSSSFQVRLSSYVSCGLANYTTTISEPINLYNQSSYCLGCDISYQSPQGSREMNQQAFHFDAAGIDCLKELLPLIPLSEKRENGIKPSELLAPDGLVYRLLVV